MWHLLERHEMKRLSRGRAAARRGPRPRPALPAGTDPCGEKGEFHSFVYGGPMFDFEIPVVAGKRVVRDQFVFADLTGAASPASLVPQRLE